MANQTYLRILQAVELFASEHMQIKKFASDFPGQMPNFATKDEEYPILFISPVSSIFDQFATTFVIEVYCFDIIQKDRENINTILSDTHGILSDLNLWILNSNPAGFDIIETSPTLEPINNALLDYAAGWKMTVTIVADSYGVCEIPFANAPVVTEIVNNICYTSYLTCDTLIDCPVITGITNDISILQGEFNPIISGYFSPTENNLVLTKADGSTVVITSEINIITVTHDYARELITNSQLVAGVTYKITDADIQLYGGTEIYLFALTTNKLDTDGVGMFLNPIYDHSVKGFNIFNSNSNYIVDNVVIWGGYVWLNKSNITGTIIDNYTLSDNWIKLDFDVKTYNKVFDKIKYDINHDKILYRNERNSNEVSFSFEALNKIQLETGDYSPIKAFQWGNYVTSNSYDTYIDYIGIGNQKIVNSYNNNINYNGQSQIYINLTNNSYFYGNTYQINQDSKINLSNITLDNSNILYNTLEKDIILNNINLKDNSYILNSIFTNTTLNGISLTNNSYFQSIIINNAVFNFYILNNNSYISDCLFEGVDNNNMLYENNGTQISVSTNYSQTNSTIKNTSISVVIEPQNGWFFLGDLPNSTTTNLVGRDNENRLVDVDMSPYLTGYTLTSSGITTALGYTPYNSTNPSSYISGITSGNITSALGYSPISADTYVTGGTYSNGVIKLKNNLGGSFDVTGLYTGYTLTSSGVTTALGYTPYNSTNPNGYISGITSGNVTTALGYTPYNSSNPNGYISGYTLTSSGVTAALGYTPYNSSNPSGYISGITSGNVTTALGYVPYNATNPNGYITGDTYTTGGTYSNGIATFKNNTGGTFTVNGFSTGYTLTSSGVTTALGYTPYNSTNPSGYISGITSSNVTNALGYTPYNSTNPNGYITADTYTTGGTYSNGNTVFTNNTGGTFSIGGYYTGYTLTSTGITSTLGYVPVSADTYTTGGTYSNGVISIKNNLGVTFNISGLSTGYTLTSTGITTALGYVPYNSTNPNGYISSYSDTYTTGGTYSNGVSTFTNNTGGTFTVAGYYTGYTLTSSAIASTLGYVPVSADTYSTGGTYSNGVITLKNNLGGSFNVSGLSTGYTLNSAGITTALGYSPVSADTYTTGGTYSNGSTVFTNNTGGTFSVSGFSTGYTLTSSAIASTLGYSPISADTYTTGGTYSNGVSTFKNNIGGSFSVSGYSTGGIDTYTTGGTYSNGVSTFKNNTGGTFSITGFSTGYTLTSTGITSTLGYIPYNSTNPNNYISDSDAFLYACSF